MEGRGGDALSWEELERKGGRKEEKSNKGLEEVRPSAFILATYI